MSLGVTILILAVAGVTVAAFLGVTHLSLEARYLILAIVAATVTGLLLGWVGVIVALIPVAGGYVEARLRRRSRTSKVTDA